jgi:hypothetical protein
MSQPTYETRYRIVAARDGLTDLPLVIVTVVQAYDVSIGLTPRPPAEPAPAATVPVAGAEMHLSAAP